MLPEKHGLAARIVPAYRLDDLRRDIDALLDQGLIDQGIRREYLEKFLYGIPDGVRSVIVVASRMPGIRFTFIKNGATVRAWVPPTYVHGARYDRMARETLEDVLRPHRIVPAAILKKPLAVRSGLAAYGRNNVSYVEGMGSYHWLSAFFTDLPCPDAYAWREPTMMESCAGCGICGDRCPAGAITGERFLLHAERCITFHNEKPGNVPFPPWLDPSWHNCLVGCLRCQESCPANRGMLNKVDGADFTEEETSLILAGTPQDRLPPQLKNKLEAYDLLSSLDILPRNLAALLR